MAIRVTTRNPALPVYFDVSQRVGLNCPNQRRDVLLVQYLLKKTWDGYPQLAPALPQGGIRVDGRITIHDIYSILHYQFKNGYSGHGIYLDAKVSPTHGLLGTHGVQYTIVYLNLGLRAAFPRLHEHPDSERDFPAELLPLLAPGRAGQPQASGRMMHRS